MEPSLLERYRSDRRKLLNFLLSFGLIKQVRTPSGCSTSTPYLDLDALSSDYVLDCIKSGNLFSFSEKQKYFGGPEGCARVLAKGRSWPVNSNFKVLLTGQKAGVC